MPEKITLPDRKSAKDRLTEVDPYLRSAAYKELSSLHSYPEESRLHEIKGREIALRKLFNELSSREAFALLPFQERVISSIEDVLPEKLQAEYVRLFDYQPLCAPYETSYPHTNCMEHAEIVLALKGLYNENGLDTAASLQEPPDYLVLELEFMHFLTHMEGNSRNDGNGEIQKYIKAEKRFLGKHLALWISEFSKCVKQNSNLSFFQNLADLTETFVKLDYDYVCTLKMP